MPDPTASKASSSDASAAPAKRRRRAGVLVAVVIGVVTALYVANRPEPVGSAPLVPVFEHVEALGYTANRSLAGRYRPGDVLQTAEPEPLATPILALRSELCFPDLEPTRSPFPLPDDTASEQASFGLAGAQVAKVFPGLALDDSAASSSRLVFLAPQVVALPKLEMSGRFSAACVERLDAARTAGDQPEWFAAVLEAVVAEGMTLEVTWKRGTSAEARASIERQAKTALEDAAPPSSRSDGSLASAAEVRMEASDSRQTVWKVDAPVVLGYRTRTVQSLHAASAPEPDDLRQAFADDGGAFVGRLAIRAQTSDGWWPRVGPEHVFRTGGRWRFEVESSRPARLFIFHQAPGGERAELWPAGRGEPNRVEPGRPVRVPVPPAAFEMQATTGLETFFVALAEVEAAERQRPPEVSWGDYVLRGLGDAEGRGVGIVDDADLWLYFRPENDEWHSLRVLSKPCLPLWA